MGDDAGAYFCKCWVMYWLMLELSLQILGNVVGNGGVHFQMLGKGELWLIFKTTQRFQVMLALFCPITQKGNVCRSAIEKKR